MPVLRMQRLNATFEIEKSKQNINFPYSHKKFFRGNHLHYLGFRIPQWHKSTRNDTQNIIVNSQINKYGPTSLSYLPLNREQYSAKLNTEHVISYR